MSLTFSMPGMPVAKPRGRQLLLGRRGPAAVVKWLDFRDAIVLAAIAAGWRPYAQAEPVVLKVVAYFAIPPSWSAKKARAAAGGFHRSKPDANHVWNAVADGLFKADERLAVAVCVKRWDDGRGERVVVTLTNDLEEVLRGA